MQNIISRKAFLSSLAFAVTLLVPSDAKASSQETASSSNSLFTADVIDDVITIKDRLTGEWVTFSGSLVEEQVITLNYSSGRTAILSRVDDSVYLDGSFVLSIPVDAPTSRACVEMSRKRFKVDTRGKDALGIASTIVSLFNIPIAIAINLVSQLLSFTSFNSTEYVELITYYCDAPTPRMRYVNNYYTDSSYSKIKYTASGDSEFVNP